MSLHTEPLSRQAIAAYEVGHTKASPLLVRTITFFFFASITLVPLVGQVVDLTRGPDHPSTILPPSMRGQYTTTTASQVIEVLSIVQEMRNAVAADGIVICRPNLTPEPVLGKGLENFGRRRDMEKRPVRWEFAARESSGIFPEEPSESSPASSTPLDPRDGIRVSATIQEITRPPRPGAVPYNDCLVAAHLRDITLDSGALDAEEIVVFTFGMQDNEWTASARWRAGDRITLDLVPWESAVQDFGSLNRVELTDLRTLRLPTFIAALPGERLIIRAPNPPLAIDRIATSLIESVPLENRSAAIARARGEVQSIIDGQGGLEAWFGGLTAFHQAFNDRISNEKNIAIGRGGWLFSRLLAEYVTIPPGSGLAEWKQEYVERYPDAYVPTYNSAVSAITDTARQLRESGVLLLFVPIPQKAEVYPEQIHSEVPPDALVSPQRYAVLRELMDAGVEVVDVLPALMALKGTADDPLYPKFDIHWHDRAVRSAAKDIADLIDDMEWHRLEKHATLNLHLEDQVVVCAAPLLMQAGLPADGSEEETDVVASVRDADGVPYDFKGYPSAPILVIGDSFMIGNKPGGSFAARLAHELGTPVAGHYERNGAQNVPTIFARQGPEIWAHRKVIVWYTVSGMLGRHWRAVQFTSESNSSQPELEALPARPRP